MTVLVPINTTPAPSRLDTPDFAARADAYHAWLPAAVDAMNTQNTENNALAADVTTKSAAAVVAAAVVTSANPIANAAAAAASAATASSASSAAAAAALASSNARDAAIAAAAVASAPTEQLSAISQSLHRGAVVKSIIYDTSKDSDGGAWRKRCTDKSWYNETLGGIGWVGQQPSEAAARAYIGSLASPELVTNGTFTTDTSGWTSSNATLSVVGGQLQVVGTGGTIHPKADLVLTLIVGRTYHVQFEITTASTQGITIIGETLDPQTGAGYYYPNAVGTYTLSFVATNTTRTLSLVTNSPNTSTGSFDNVSVKIVDPAIATVGYVYQSKSDNKFYRLETSGTTEVFRGLTREFPAVVAIVAEAARVVIYDLTVSSCPMWFVSKITFNTSIAAMQGRLVVGRGPSANMMTFEFTTDSLWFINNTGTTRLVDRIGSTPVHTWTGLTSFPQDETREIVSASVNDVAITVLDTAPIDPATGLPVPTIAVATSGGVSVIKDDGTVYNITRAGGHAKVLFLPDKRIQLSSTDADNVQYGPIPTSTLVDSSWRSYYLSAATTVPNLVGSSTGKLLVGGGVAGTSGVTLLKENPATPSKGMVSYITNTYNSGWQVGDSRGAYLADTTAETITASGELAVSTNYLVPVTFDNTLSSVTNTSFVSTGVTTVGRVALGFTTVVGKTYTVLVTCVSVSSGNVQPFIKTGVDGVGTTIGTGANIGVGTQSITFTATTATSCVLWVGTVVAASYSFNNISVKLAEPDRSVKNNGLVINGTLTKTAVASGAGLVAYSGFSASNYLEQPYNSNLDFGTGDFCVMGWFKHPGSAVFRIVNRNTDEFRITSSGSEFQIGPTPNNYYKTGLALADNLWHFCVVTRVGATLTLYIDGAFSGVLLGGSYSGAPTFGASAGNPSTVVGSDKVNSSAAGSLSLLRISATAPSQDQISHIYRTELPLFQANAQCTLAGTTSSVTAMSYDDATNELHVTTAGSRSGFIDLLRVESDTLAVGTSTTVAAFEGTVITGGSTSARVYAPALNLRDELRRKEIARRALGRLPVFFDYTATASQTAFVAPKGFTVKALYKNGTLMRETTTGTYWSRSNDGFQETATLSVGASVSDWISLMCVRA